MRRTSCTFITLAFVFVLAANVWATPITFTTDPGNSVVTVKNYSVGAYLQGTLLLTTTTTFTLNDAEAKTLDFFTLQAIDTGWLAGGVGFYKVSAKLAFSEPPIAGTGAGGGAFINLFGVVSAGILTWDPLTIPDYFTVAGNEVKIDLEDGIAISFGNPVTVHAYVTNNGGAPVPEPATLLLLGSGLVGLAAFRRKLKK